MVDQTRTIFLFLCFIPLVFSQCNTEKARTSFKRSVYEFSTDLITRISQETDFHFVTSPLSIWTLISAISEGADGNTLSEIKTVLRHHPHKCFVGKYYELSQEVISNGDGTTVERAGAIIVDKNVSLNKTFAKQVGRYGIADFMEISFERFIEGANTINAYVRQKTHGQIDSIIAPEELQNMYLLMVDVINFKGTWNQQFVKEDTEVSAFYNEDGRQIGDVNLMFTSGEFNCEYIPLVKAQVLELPYGSSKRFSMLVFLPFQSKIADTIDSLKKISVKTILSVFKKKSLDNVLVQLPRFKISTDLDNLKELLNDMGIIDMFETRAELPYVAKFALYVSDIMQKAVVEVNEEGTSASAVSSAGFMAKSMPLEFTANKPFVFMIIDRQTELVLFTGAYSKPEVI